MTEEALGQEMARLRAAIARIADRWIKAAEAMGGEKAREAFLAGLAHPERLRSVDAWLRDDCAFGEVADLLLIARYVSLERRYRLDMAWRSGEASA